MKEQIDIRHIRYFRMVAHELHFGRAAELLGMSQAPLSQQIRQLEERLEVRLFRRTTRSVMLTEAGSAFLQYAEKLLHDLDSGIRETQRLGGIEAGRIRVGGVGLAVNTLFPDIIADFRRSHPRVSLEVYPRTTAELVEDLISGRLDVGFIRRPLHMDTLEAVKVMSEGFSAALHKDHPLASRDSLSILDLKDQKFIGYKPIVGNNYFTAVVECCLAAGFRPEIIEETAFTKSISAFVGAGIGIGVMPESSEIFMTRNVVYRRITDIPKSIELLLAWPSGKPNRIVERFITISRRVAQSFS